VWPGAGPRKPGLMLDWRQQLRADCRRCVGLCCVAPAFVASADFALDKPAGRACPHLSADFGAAFTIVFANGVLRAVRCSIALAQDSMSLR
jgi:hypothetical protein